MIQILKQLFEEYLIIILNLFFFVSDTIDDLKITSFFFGFLPLELFWLNFPFLHFQPFRELRLRLLRLLRAGGEAGPAESA